MIGPKITIDGFDRGMVLDPTKQLRNGFNFCSGIDIFREPGTLQVSQAMAVMAEADATNDITSAIRKMVKYSNNSKVYGVGNGRIYDYNNTVVAKWSLVHADGNTGGSDICEFNGNLHWASNTNLGKFDGTTWTDSFKAFTADDNKWHPMAKYLGKLMIGDGRYIATLDSDDTWVATDLTLPAGYRVRSLEVYGDRLVIGTWRGSNIREQPEATLFTWDGINGHEEENSWTKKKRGILAIAPSPWSNTLIVFAGLGGDIYEFNGVELKWLIRIPKINRSLGYYGVVNPGAIAEYMGNLVFGFSAGSDTTVMAPYYGIYTLGKSESGRISLTKSHIQSVGEQNSLSISSIFQAGTNQFYASWGHSATTYGVDKLDIDDTPATGPYWESQVYEVSKSNQKELIKGVGIIARPLVATSNLVVEYKLDNEASWQSLGTITSSNQGQVLKGVNKRARTIQIRLEFVNSGTGSGNASPRIQKINIY